MNTTKRHQAWTDVAMFEDQPDAADVETVLRGKGFETRIHDDRLFRWFLFLRPPRTTYRVQVHEEDVKSADYHLKATSPGPLQRAIHCPECDSLRVAYPQMTRKFFLPTVLLHAGIIFRVIDHECYCWHCHYTWNLPREHAHPAERPAPQT